MAARRVGKGRRIFPGEDGGRLLFGGGQAPLLSKSHADPPSELPPIRHIPAVGGPRVAFQERLRLDELSVDPAAARKSSYERAAPGTTVTDGTAVVDLVLTYPSDDYISLKNERGSEPDTLKPQYSTAGVLSVVIAAPTLGIVSNYTNRGGSVCAWTTIGQLLGTAIQGLIVNSQFPDALAAAVDKCDRDPESDHSTSATEWRDSLVRGYEDIEKALQDNPGGAAASDRHNEQRGATHWLGIELVRTLADWIRPMTEGPAAVVHAAAGMAGLGSGPLLRLNAIATAIADSAVGSFWRHDPPDAAVLKAGWDLVWVCSHPPRPLQASPEAEQWGRLQSPQKRHRIIDDSQPDHGFSMPGLIEWLESLKLADTRRFRRFPTELVPGPDKGGSAGGGFSISRLLGSLLDSVSAKNIDKKQLYSNRAELRWYFHELLRHKGYTVREVLRNSTVFVFIKAPFSILCSQAELIKLNVPLRGEIWKLHTDAINPVITVSKHGDGQNSSQDAVPLPTITCSAMNTFPHDQTRPVKRKGTLIELKYERKAGRITDKNALHIFSAAVRSFSSTGDVVMLANLHEMLEWEADFVLRWGSGSSVAAPSPQPPNSPANVQLRFRARPTPIGVMSMPEARWDTTNQSDDDQTLRMIESCSCAHTASDGRPRHIAELLASFYTRLSELPESDRIKAIIFYPSNRPPPRAASLWVTERFSDQFPSVLINPAAAQQLRNAIQKIKSTEKRVGRDNDFGAIVEIHRDTPPSGMCSPKRNAEGRTAQNLRLNQATLKVDECAEHIDFVAAPFQKRLGGHFVGMSLLPDRLTGGSDPSELAFVSSRRQLLCVHAVQNIDLAGLDGEIASSLTPASWGERFEPGGVGHESSPVLRLLPPEDPEQEESETMKANLDYLLKKRVYSDYIVPHDVDEVVDFKHFDELLVQTVQDDVSSVGSRSGLYRDWRKTSNAPLTRLREYLGERATLYVSWVQSLTKSLAVPIVAGIIAMIFGIGVLVASNTSNYNEAMRMMFNNEATVVFALVLIGWAAFFSENWKRTQITHAVEWDVTGFEENEVPRPGFKGQSRPNIVTGEPESYLGVVRRFVLLTYSNVCSITFFIVVCIAIAAVISLRVILEHSDRDAVSTAIVPALANSLVVFTFATLYNKLAYVLTDLENHKTQTAYNDSLITKLFAFQFVNIFSGLIYLAYFRDNQKLWGNEDLTDQCDSSCTGDLTIQVASLLVVTPLLRIFLDSILPRWLAARAKHSTWYERELAAGGVPLCYDPTIPEYTEKVIQYALVTMFASTFPLAPLIFWALNKLDIWFDAGRLLLHGRRVLGFRAEDIGRWQDIVLVINILSVVNNAFLLGYTGTIAWRLESTYGSSAKLWFVIAFEHVGFGIIIAVRAIVPDIPATIKAKLAATQLLVSRHTKEFNPQDVGLGSETEV